MEIVPVKFALKVANLGNSLNVTIPKEIAAHTNLKKGDTVEMWVDNSHILIEKRRRSAYLYAKRKPNKNIPHTTRKPNRKSP